MLLSACSLLLSTDIRLSDATPVHYNTVALICARRPRWLAGSWLSNLRSLCEPARVQMASSVPYEPLALVLSLACAGVSALELCVLYMRAFGCR